MAKGTCEIIIQIGQAFLELSWVDVCLYMILFLSRNSGRGNLKKSEKKLLNFSIFLLDRLFGD